MDYSISWGGGGRQELYGFVSVVLEDLMRILLMKGFFGDLGIGLILLVIQG